jgi:hypothetical protein
MGYIVARKVARSHHRDEAYRHRKVAPAQYEPTALA